MFCCGMILNGSSSSDNRKELSVSTGGVEKKFLDSIWTFWGKENNEKSDGSDGSGDRLDNTKETKVEKVVPKRIKVRNRSFINSHRQFLCDTTNTYGNNNDDGYSGERGDGNNRIFWVSHMS
jgi:hypothetical protein